MEPAEGRTAPRFRLAPIAAALSLAYALVVTVVLLVVTNFFRDEDDATTVMVWLILPLASAFLSWLAVGSGRPLLRVFVWLLILASLFFCWIAIFSIGVFYLPMPLLLVVAVLSPWNSEQKEA
jgi:glucan phosphoethanolaminetransferase (alkaline phosphatase superfamily)